MNGFIRNKKYHDGPLDDTDIAMGEWDDRVIKLENGQYYGVKRLITAANSSDKSVQTAIVFKGLIPPDTPQEIREVRYDSNSEKLHSDDSRLEFAKTLHTHLHQIGGPLFVLLQTSSGSGEFDSHILTHSRASEQEIIDFVEFVATGKFNDPFQDDPLKG